MRSPDEHEKALAAYIVRWLRRRNGRQLEVTFGEMTVHDLERLHEELEHILLHRGHPPNWEPLP